VLFEGIYFVFFSSPQKEERNPAHKTAHLQTAASQHCNPKFTKELFLACPLPSNISTLLRIK